MRLVILGNAGSGKTTLARRLAEESGAALLGLDEIAFVAGTPERLPLAASVARLSAFLEAHAAWVIEGCYADLAAEALRHADELRWLNPGVAVCSAHCRARPFEADKFASPADQAAQLEPLLAWVAQYDTRDDDYGLARHREVFEAFDGRKRQDTSVDEYAAPPSPVLDPGAVGSVDRLVRRPTP